MLAPMRDVRGERAVNNWLPWSMRSRRFRATGAILVAVVTLGAGCSSDRTVDPLPETSLQPLGTPEPPASLGIDLGLADRCDPIAPEQCLLPFPNDYFTVADASTPTRRRVALVAESLPANVAGAHIDPTEWNRLDGFSPGAPLLVPIGADIDPAQLDGVADIAASLADDARVVAVDATSGERLATWAELDANAPDTERPTLIIRPASNWRETHTIVVGIRTLTGTTGVAVPPSAAYRAYRDRLATTDATFEARRDSMEATFATLAEHGVDRRDLWLSWSFTVASSEAIAGRMLHIRDESFAALGDGVPAFRIDQVEDAPEPTMLRRISGSFDVPNWLSGDGGPGERFVLGADALPTRGAGTLTARFICTIPAGATADGPVRMSLYGHGLFGDASELNGDLAQPMAERYGIAYCGTDLIGMAEEDVPNAATILQDLSRFPTLADRSQQGLLNALFLARLLVHDDGLTSRPEFGDDSGRPLLDRAQLFYDGNSQGAILGGALCAVAIDFDRCVLGEAGMNYSTLLHRSVDFDIYKAIFDPNYPSQFDQLVGISLIQMLWDRSETNGYALHLGNNAPLPGSPKKTVLLLGAFGDHQVSEWSLQVEARTVGAKGHEPYVATDRIRASEYGFGIETLHPNHTGSAYFLFDTGSPPSPFENRAPREGHDPHDDTPQIDEAMAIKDAFMRAGGAIVDACGAAPCTGPPFD